MISFDTNNIKIISLKELRPNTWNPKLKDTREYRKILKSIAKDGQKLPVVVRVNEQDGIKYEIIDGQQRYDALVELKQDKIAINDYGIVSDVDAKNETLWTQLQVPFDNVLLAPLLAELAEEDVEIPYDDDMIEELLNIDNEDLESMLKDNLDSDVRTFKVILGEEAYSVIMQAINKIQSEHDNISEARAIELICADYLAG